MNWSVIKVVFALSLVNAATVGSPSSLRGQSEAETNAIVDNHAELRKRYNDVDFAGDMSRSGTTQQREYMIHEDCYKVSIKSDKANPKDAKAPTVNLHLKSTKNYYNLTKAEASSRFIVVYSGPTLPDKSFAQSVDWFVASPYASFMFLGRDMASWLEEPGFRVVSLSPTGGSYEMKFEYVPPGGEPKPGQGYPGMIGSIFFDPSNKWSIKKSVFYFKLIESGQTRDIVQTIDIKYSSEEINGVRMPSVVDNQVPPLKSPMYLYRVTSAQAKQFDQAIFTPAGYGVPGQFEEPPSQPSTSRF